MRRFALLLLVALVVLAACAAPDDKPSTPSAGVPATAQQLAGREYVLTRMSLGGQDLRVSTVPQVPALSFTADTFHLEDGCNDLYAGYTLDVDGQLQVHDPRGPISGCTGNLEEQAQRLAAVLTTGGVATIDGSDLELRKEDLAVVFTPAP